MFYHGRLGAVTPGAQAAIQAAAVRYGLDPAFLTAVAQQESGLNQSAISPAGAIGIMQLMPATAAQYGANPYDLAQNVDAGAHFLSDMLARYGQDETLALAAYNAGPGNVDKYGGVPPFQETQNYVSSVLANYTPSYDYGSGQSAGQTTTQPAGVPGDTTGVLAAQQIPTAGVNGTTVALAVGAAALLVWAMG